MLDPANPKRNKTDLDPENHPEDSSDDFEVTERRTRRTEFLIALTVLVIFVGLIAYRIRGHRHFTQLKAEFHPPAKTVAPSPLLPGGQEPITLSRSAIVNSQTPEFLSATLLPGRGLNVFQIIASIPGEGETPLLASPPLEDAAKTMTGTGADANGATATNRGAPFLLPWSGRVYGSPQGENIATEWNGRSLLLPAAHGSNSAVEGLLLDQDADDLHNDVMPDGALQSATYDLDNFDGRWPSNTEAKVSMLLSGRMVTLTVTVRNTGSVAEPMGIGWMPHFALTGDRNLIRLRIPQGQRVEERPDGKPTGKFLAVDGTPYDFTQPDGAVLGNRNIDASFVHLHPALMDSGPAVELIQPGYGLRLTALTTAIRSIRIVAPADKNYIIIQPNFNYDDPFGSEWPHGENTGMAVLEPGQTVQWKLRLDIFSPSRPNPTLGGSEFDPRR